ncbi:MAG: cysteine hydrolase [Methanobacteriota archaeon]|nr:MAG: cysteine hydrolase [Euryarchaeota archaeon]
MRPALLVIDIQNAWLNDSAELRESVDRRLDVMNAAIRWFRERKYPIVAVYHESSDGKVTPGTDAFEFTSAVEIEKKDFRITKHYANSFNKTGLDMTLRRMGCETVVIVGLSASGCALATYFGAGDGDFRAYMVKDGVASHDEEHVRFAEEICETISVGEFDKILQVNPEQGREGRQESSSAQEPSD